MDQVLCRVTVGLSGAPVGSFVRVDPDNPYMARLLANQYLVPVTPDGEDKPAEAPVAALVNENDNPEESRGDEHAAAEAQDRTYGPLEDHATDASTPTDDSLLDDPVDPGGADYAQ